MLGVWHTTCFVSLSNHCCTPPHRARIFVQMSATAQKIRSGIKVVHLGIFSNSSRQYSFWEFHTQKYTSEVALTYRMQPGMQKVHAYFRQKNHPQRHKTKREERKTETQVGRRHQILFYMSKQVECATKVSLSCPSFEQLAGQPDSCTTGNLYQT